MANLVPVVGEQYVTPEDTSLSVARKERSLSDGNFTITDGSGDVLFKLNDKVVSLRDKRTLYNASDVPVLSLHKKLISLHNTWEVFAGESNDVLFTIKKAHLTDKEGEAYEVKITGSSEAQYLLKGNFPERSYSIVYGGDFVVAEVGKQHFSLSSLFGRGKHKYGVRVNGGADLAFVSALVTVVDSIHSEDGNDSSDSD